MKIELLHLHAMNILMAVDHHIFKSTITGEDRSSTHHLAGFDINFIEH